MIAGEDADTELFSVMIYIILVLCIDYKVPKIALCGFVLISLHKVKQLFPTEFCERRDSW